MPDIEFLAPLGVAVPLFAVLIWWLVQVRSDLKEERKSHDGTRSELKQFMMTYMIKPHEVDDV